MSAFSLTVSGLVNQGVELPIPGDVILRDPNVKVKQVCLIHMYQNSLEKQLFTWPYLTKRENQRERERIRERERERERDRETERQRDRERGQRERDRERDRERVICVCVCVHFAIPLIESDLVRFLYFQGYILVETDVAKV